jgi:transposase
LLDEQQILDELEKNNYHCIKQIIAMIKEKFNINTSQSGVQRFLKKHSLKYLKSGSIPAKANPEEQFSFYKTILKPLIAKAKAKVPKIVLFSMDASHHVLGANYLGNIYGKTRRFITTFSGRKRYNVLGAINLISKKILTVTNDTYITATQVCELLELIAKEYAGKTIYILLDNARYQKCNLVKELAEKLKINLVFISPYSPNLNPIERFWKHVKKRLRSRYFDDFSIKKKTIDDIVDCASTDDKKAIDKLITFKFQLFDKFKQINNIAFVEDVKKKVKKHQK